MSLENVWGGFPPSFSWIRKIVFANSRIFIQNIE